MPRQLSSGAMRRSAARRSKALPGAQADFAAASCSATRCGLAAADCLAPAGAAAEWAVAAKFVPAGEQDGPTRAGSTRDGGARLRQGFPKQREKSGLGDGPGAARTVQAPCPKPSRTTRDHTQHVVLAHRLHL